MVERPHLRTNTTTGPTISHRHLSHRCQALLRSNRRAGQSQPAMATTILHQDQTHGFRLRVCPSRASVPGHGNRETGLLFRQPWESIAATCLGASTARKNGRTKTARYFVDGSRSSSRARLARRLLWSVLATSTGRSESHRASTLTCCTYRDLFARLDSFRVVYVTADQSMFPKAESIFSRLCGGSGRGPNGMPLDPEVRRLLDHVSRSRSVRTTADGLVRQAPTGPTQR